MVIQGLGLELVKGTDWNPEQRRAPRYAPESACSFVPCWFPAVICWFMQMTPRSGNLKRRSPCIPWYLSPVLALRPKTPLFINTLEVCIPNDLSLAFIRPYWRGIMGNVCVLVGGINHLNHIIPYMIGTLCLCAQPCSHQFCIQCYPPLAAQPLKGCWAQLPNCSESPRYMSYHQKAPSWTLNSPLQLTPW